MIEEDGQVPSGAPAAPIACRLSGQAYIERQAEVTTLWAEAQQRRELADGYAFRFPGNAAMARRLIDYIIAERDCCPFFTFTLVAEPDNGPFWLHLQGPEGAKEAVIAGGSIQATS